MNRKTWIIISIAFLCSLLLLSIFPQLISKYSFDQQLSQHLLEKPSASFPFGTDELGRDLLSRCLYGARISITCGLMATLIAAVAGILIGGLAGYKGGFIDNFLMRMVDMLYSIPDLLFYIILGVFFGHHFFGMVLTLSALSWIHLARIVRGEILKTKNEPYIEAAHAVGTPSYLIFFRHLLPQLKNIILISLLYKIPSIILAESTLSFLGLGLQPPFSSWGSLTSEGYQHILYHPHLVLFPAILMTVTIFCFHFLGQNLAKKRGL